MDIDNKLIVTVAVVMHGSIFTLDLDDETTNIFQNVRLLCGSGSFSTYETDVINALVLNTRLRKYFARDIEEGTSTFSMMGQSKTGKLIGNITYDKVLSTSTSDSNLFAYLYPYTYLEGVYLISIHRGKKLIYPTNPKEFINLLLIKDIIKVSDIFNTDISKLQHFSSKFPDIKKYVHEEISIKNSKLTEEEKTKKIEEVKQKLTDVLYGWHFTLDNSGKKIEIIKMSVLIEIIKIIISNDCIINFLDYSCSNISRFVPEEQKLYQKYATGYDIEQGLPNTKLGGKKYHKKSYRKKHKHQRKRKSNKTIKRKILNQSTMINHFRINK